MAVDPRRSLPVHRMFGCGLVAACAASFFTTALAHGDWQPKHGGQMNDGETSFELVLRPYSASVYVSDHGEDVAISGSSGSLSLQQGGRTFASPLKVVGKNRFDAALPTKPVRGDPVVVRVVMANGSVAVGRFLVK